MNKRHFGLSTLDVHNFLMPMPIYTALALEQVFFENYIVNFLNRHRDLPAQELPIDYVLPVDVYQILFWKSQPAVVIGRNQNPWKECNLSFLKDYNIALARRDTGGGAVYHDEGNLNITVISKAPDKIQNQVWQNLQVFVDALKISHDINACITDHNDVLVEGKKITGSAMRIIKGVLLHHFTVLLNADLSLLRRSLAPKKSFALNTKAAVSRPYPVSNIHCASNLLIDEYMRIFGASHKITPSVKIYKNLSGQGLQETNEMQITKDRLTSSEWIFGRSPAFEVSVVIDAATYTAKFSNGLLQEICSGQELIIPHKKIFMTCAALHEAAKADTEKTLVKRFAAALCSYYN